MYIKYIGEVLNRTLTSLTRHPSYSSEDNSSLSSSNSSLNKRVSNEDKLPKNKQVQLKPVTVTTTQSHLWSRPNDSMQIGSIDSTGRYVPYLKHDPVDDDTDMTVGNINDAWDLKNDEIDPNFDLNNVVHTSSKSKLRKKFNRFLNMLPMKNRNGRQRSRSRSTETGVYFRVPNQDEDDDEKMAERIAAMIVNDVMKANNQLQQ
jgi:hypothetical protein